MSYLASKMLAASVLRVPNRTDLICRNNILGMPTAGLPLLVADETALRPPRWVRNPDVKLTKIKLLRNVPHTMHHALQHTPPNMCYLPRAVHYSLTNLTLFCL